VLCRRGSDARHFLPFLLQFLSVSTRRLPNDIHNQIWPWKKKKQKNKKTKHSLNFKSLSLNFSIFKISNSLKIRGLSPPRSLVHSGGSPHLLFPEVACLHLFLLALRASVLFPHTVPDQGPLYSNCHSTLFTFPPKPLPPSPLVIAFFSLPSGTEEPSLEHFSLLSVLDSVDSILCILYGLFLFFFFFVFG
jgi:hypothetical protein